LESSTGNGAVLITSPDAPNNIIEDSTLRTKSSLGLTWNQPTFNGGSKILDYTVSISQDNTNFAILASGVTDTKYFASGLTAGVTY